MDGQGVHRWGPLPGVIELEYFIGLGKKGGVGRGMLPKEGGC